MYKTELEILIGTSKVMIHANENSRLNKHIRDQKSVDPKSQIGK